MIGYILTALGMFGAVAAMFAALLVRTGRILERFDGHDRRADATDKRLDDHGARLHAHDIKFAKLGRPRGTTNPGNTGSHHALALVPLHDDGDDEES